MDTVADKNHDPPTKFVLGWRHGGHPMGRKHSLLSKSFSIFACLNFLWDKVKHCPAYRAGRKSTSSDRGEVLAYYSVERIWKQKGLKVSAKENPRKCLC